MKEEIKDQPTLALEIYWRNQPGCHSPKQRGKLWIHNTWSMNTTVPQIHTSPIFETQDLDTSWTHPIGWKLVSLYFVQGMEPHYNLGDWFYTNATNIIYYCTQWLPNKVCSRINALLCALDPLCFFFIFLLAPGVQNKVPTNPGGPLARSFPKIDLR